MAYGIEKLRVYPMCLSLDIEALCEARGRDYAGVARTIMATERGVVAPWEDTVTLAVNAAHGLLDEETIASVELLIVATETSVDQEKPVSSWVHRWLGTPSHCRNFEIKHACYGGMAAIRMALSWLRSQEGRPCRALVLCADTSLSGLGEPYEPAFGACAAAILLSDTPDLLEIDPVRYGVSAIEVTDVTRPALGVETGNDETSVFTYLETLEAAWEDFLRRTGEAVSLDTAFKRHIYHLPFAGMALQAHRMLTGHALGLDRKAARAHFDQRVAPGLVYSKRIGSSFSSSTLHALLSQLDHAPGLVAGDPISVFAYGSGSCAEFYEARIGARAEERAKEAGLAALLDARRPLSLSEYEAAERARIAAMGARDHTPDHSIVPDWFDDRIAGSGQLVLERIDTYERIYRRA
ncbi:MAG: hydroxymethylglutaryl-CoA synthase [Pseudomonadota bacterium]